MLRMFSMYLMISMHAPFHCYLHRFELDTILW
ncbi:hypothetical protein F383_01260 [Gossypium arboreum]|uniref:Uncharacterized protein n=1 Tax=Gossypium arboreum TaxID=29729 RepID=A0A0B0NFU8_GOSAR|nr:hypothetical protein F383_01260 [Gossypium arboreum]